LIYDFPTEDAPIRQGDIFVQVPRIDLPPLNELVVLDEDGAELPRRWTEVAKTEPITIAVAVRSVSAIVATQDCDAIRTPEIVLCEIQPFAEVEGKVKNAETASKPAKRTETLVKIITQHARINQKWFYLPPDDRIGFRSRMAVDFRLTLRVPRRPRRNESDARGAH
jgi:hypothetical protein